jgi:hypothetical protein
LTRFSDINFDVLIEITAVSDVMSRLKNQHLLWVSSDAFTIMRNRYTFVVDRWSQQNWWLAGGICHYKSGNCGAAVQHYWQ